MDNAKAIIASHYGDRNLGDVAISQTVRRALLDVVGDDIVLWVRRLPTGHGEQCVSSPHYLYNLLFGSVKPLLVVIGGGGLLQNATSLGNLLVHLGAAMWGRLRGARVVLAGVGIGPLSGALARMMAGAVVRMANGGCLVRDEESRIFATRWCRTPVRLAPDLAFAMPFFGVAIPHMRAGRPPRLLLSLRPPVGGKTARGNPSAAYLRQMSSIIRIVSDIAGEQGLELALLATHPEQDSELFQRVRAQDTGLPEAVEVVPDTPQELLDAIQSGDLVVGMRLHSLIFGAVAGAGIVGIGYDPKVAGLISQMGLDEQFVPMCDGEVDLSCLRTVVRRSAVERATLGGRAGAVAWSHGEIAASELAAILERWKQQ